MDIRCRKLSIENDIDFLYSWVTHSKAKYWLMQSYTESQVFDEYQKISRSESQDAYIGIVDNAPKFLFETYNPNESPLKDHEEVYRYQIGDVGMHFLTAPTAAPITGFTKQTFDFVLSYLFDQLKYLRIVVEPDIDNKKIHQMNLRFGFKELGPLNLEYKEALVFLLKKDDYINLQGNHGR